MIKECGHKIKSTEWYCLSCYNKKCNFTNYNICIRHICVSKIKNIAHIKCGAYMDWIDGLRKNTI